MNSIDIKSLALSLGADVCGVAGVQRFAGAPAGFHPADILPQAKSVIVFGRQMPKGVFLATTTAPYTLIRDNITRALDVISIRLVMEMEQTGSIAVPIPAAEPYTYWDTENRQGKGILSLRHAAQLAGLGSIGKSNLLLNRDYGNRLWLGAVLTDMELEQDELADTLCPEDCRICLDACPQGALDGVTIVQKKCREICFTSTEGGGYLYACILCRKECPYNMV